MENLFITHFIPERYTNTKDLLAKAIYSGFRQYNEREFDKIMQYWLLAIALLHAIVTGY